MDPDSSTIYPALTAFLLLLVLSGLFSAAEAAFTGINDSQTQRRAAEGDKKARHIMDLIRKPTVFISTVRTGSTLCAMLGLTVLSPSLTGLFLERFYQEMEVPLTAYPVFLILITILVGIVTIALGNILPGRLGDFFPDQTASLLTPFMMVMSILLRPIVWLTLGIANLGLRLLGQNPNQEPDTVTEEEIRMMVTVGEEKGAIEQSEKDMINNIFEFDDRVVTEVMTHRMEMIALKDTVQLDEAVKVARETGYSRIPVYHEDIDDIVGVLYAKDLLLFVNDGCNSKDFNIKKLLHEPFYIPETAKCTELFKDFQRKQLHMAIVIDEYGGTYGMVTMEDLLETIVGNIQDEYDKEENEYQKLSDTEYIIDGWISVDEVEDLLGIKIPDDTEYDTLGGVVVDMLGDLPEEGQHPSVQIDRVRFTVLEVDDRRISRLKAEILPDESSPEPGERRD